MGRHARTPLRHPAAGQGPRLRRGGRRHAACSAWARRSPSSASSTASCCGSRIPRRRRAWSASRTAARRRRQRRPAGARRGRRLSRAASRHRPARRPGTSGGQTLTAAGGTDGFAERVKVSGVTPNVFADPRRRAGTRPHLPRPRRRRRPAAVISDACGGRASPRRRDVLSRTVRLNGANFRSSASCRPASPIPEGEMAAWLALPLAPRDASDRNDHYLGTVARLAPGADLRAAQQDLARVAAELRREQPGRLLADPKWTLGAVSLRDRHFGRPAAAADGAARRLRGGAAHRVRQRRDHGAAAGAARAGASWRSAWRSAPAAARSCGSC